MRITLVPLLLILCLIFTGGDFAEARQVWFGFASQGQGGGMMGHGFLVVAEDDATLFYSPAYTFGVTSEKWLMYGRRFVFHADKLHFQQLYAYYTGPENRSLTLVELKLSEDEIVRLVDLLEKDVNDPKFSERESYSLLDNNCVTYPLELLNQVVAADRRLYMADVMDLTLPSKNFLSNPTFATMSRVPLYLAKHIQRQPISTGRVQVLASSGQRTASYFLDKWKSKLHQLAACYAWDETFSSVFEDSLLLKRNDDKAKLDEVQTLLAAPGCKEAPLKWKGLLTAYNDLIPESNIGLKKIVYQLKKEL